MTRVPKQGTGDLGEPEDGHGASADPSDAELVARVRNGDDASFVVLYERHFASACRLAGCYATTPADAEDLASEGFAQVLGAIRAGGGPQRAFRPYVLTVVRRLAASDAVREKRATPTSEVEVYAPLLPFEDPVLAELEASLIGRAFAALPERWQTVLWHTEVEGESPAQVAPRLGLSAGAVAALACRAREGLRKEYLQAHLSEQEMARECRKCAGKLAAYLRGSLGPRDRRRVEEHLDTCDRCPRLLLELREVSGSLRGMMAPLLLGPTFAGYFGSLADASPDETGAGPTPDGTEDGSAHQQAEGPGGRDGDGADDGHHAGDGGEPGLLRRRGGVGSSSPGTVVITLSLVGGLTVATVVGALTLSPKDPSHPRAQGRAPAATPTPASPQPTPSGPEPAPSTNPPSGSRPLRPGPGRATRTPGGTSGPAEPGTTTPSGTPSDPPNSPTSPPRSLLANGDLESPALQSPLTLSKAGDTIGPWQVVEHSVNLTRSDALKAAHGRQSIDMNGDPTDTDPATNGAIAQTFATTAHRPYTLSFALAGNVTCAPVVKTLRVQVGPATRDFSFDTTGRSASDMGWRQETVRFTAQSDQTTLRLSSTTDASSRCGPEIDSVKVVQA